MVLNGCALEVDLEHPKELRKLHNDYALAPVKIEIKKMVSSCTFFLFIRKPFFV